MGLNFLIWLVIFSITVSESVFYYQIHNLPTPLTRIIVYDTFLIVWSIITPGLYTIMNIWYGKTFIWWVLILKFVGLGIVSCLFLLGAEAIIHWIYRLSLEDERTVWSLFLQVITNRLHINVILYFTVIGLSIALLENKKTRTLEKKQSELNQQLTEAELNLLKRQMRPHFLFNSLHAISALVLKNENAKAISMITKFGDLLRESLRLDRRPWITVEEEIEMAKRYLEIHSMRFGGSFSFSMDVESGIEKLKIPSLILQPIIENSLVHGIVPNNNAGKIDISIKKQNEFYRIQVIDFVESTISSNNVKEGLGLSNTRKRLAALYDDEYDLIFGLLINKKGFFTKMSFPISKNEA